MRAHGIGELDAHMPEPTHADNRDTLAGAGIPVAQWRIEGDSCAKQWCCRIERKVVRHGEDIAFLDNNMVGISALRPFFSLGIEGIVGLDETWKIVLIVDIPLAQPTQESTKQPTPTLSPTLNLVTASPTAVTTPAISCPGTMG